MILLGAFLALLVAFYLLNEVTEKYFIPSLDKLAHRYNMSDDASGATLMAAGSSAPELFISIIAIVYGGDNFEIGVGTIVGSAIFNLLVIIGAVAMVKSTKITWQPMLRDFIFYILSIGILYWSYKSGYISLIHAILFVLAYIIYVLAVVNWKKIFPFERKIIEEKEQEEKTNAFTRIMKPFSKIVSKFFTNNDKFLTNFIVSIVFIALLSWLLVESAVIISEGIGVPKYIIALTILAFGTSVPDMISSIIVAKQDRGGMAVSNALGSNVFDILIGLGLPWMLLIIAKGEGFSTSDGDIEKHVMVLLFSVLGAFLTLLIFKWKLNKFIGILFIGAYLYYLMDVIVKAV